MATALLDSVIQSSSKFALLQNYFLPNINFAKIMSLWNTITTCPQVCVASFPRAPVLPRCLQTPPTSGIRGDLRFHQSISYDIIKNVIIFWWSLSHVYKQHLHQKSRVIRLDSIAASLFVWNWLSWQMISDDKIQITILILRRGALSSKDGREDEDGRRF